MQGLNGELVNVTVIAGTLRDSDISVTAQSPPPNSWASRAEADVAIWHLSFDAGASLDTASSSSRPIPNECCTCLVDRR